MIAVNKSLPTSNHGQKEYVVQACRNKDESQCSDLVEEVIRKGCADTLGRSRRWGVGVCGEGEEEEKMEIIEQRGFPRQQNSFVIVEPETRPTFVYANLVA